MQRRPAEQDGGYLAGEALLAAPKPPTAILVSEAIQSLGLYRKLNDAGLQPGRDVSLIGILPEERAKILSPALTTFQTDWTAIGVRLGEALISAMNRPSMARPERQARAGSWPGAVRAIQAVMPVALRAGESVHSPHDS